MWRFSETNAEFDDAQAAETMRPRSFSQTFRARSSSMSQVQRRSGLSMYSISPTVLARKSSASRGIFFAVGAR